jgi:tRNA nucleotidyltransferase (CCA-adding enzyme)
MKAGKTMTGKEILYSILMNNNVVYSIENNLEPLLNLIPELKDTIGFDHKHPHHHLDVWNHTLCALSHAPSNFDLRLVLLLHDIGKPHSCQEGEVRHFKGHPLKSYEMSLVILERLNFTQEEINHLSKLILVHDDELTIEEIQTNKESAFERFQIQYCDSLAHHPNKLEKRIAYLLDTNEKLNTGNIKEYYYKLLNEASNKKTR